MSMATERILIKIMKSFLAELMFYNFFLNV